MAVGLSLLFTVLLAPLSSSGLVVGRRCLQAAWPGTGPCCQWNPRPLGRRTSGGAAPSHGASLSQHGGAEPGAVSMSRRPPVAEQRSFLAPSVYTMVFLQVFGSAVYNSGSERHFKYIEKIFNTEVRSAPRMARPSSLFLGFGEGQCRRGPWRLWPSYLRGVSGHVHSPAHTQWALLPAQAGAWRCFRGPEQSPPPCDPERAVAGLPVISRGGTRSHGTQPGQSWGGR